MKDILLFKVLQIELGIRYFEDLLTPTFTEPGLPPRLALELTLCSSSSISASVGPVGPGDRALNIRNYRLLIR